jgi:hypothetical protein
LHKNTYTWQEKHYYALQKREIEKRGAYNSEIVGSLTYTHLGIAQKYIYMARKTLLYVARKMLRP